MFTSYTECSLFSSECCEQDGFCEPFTAYSKHLFLKKGARHTVQLVELFHKLKKSGKCDSRIRQAIPKRIRLLSGLFFGPHFHRLIELIIFSPQGLQVHTSCGDILAEPFGVFQSELLTVLRGNILAGIF